MIGRSGPVLKGQCIVTSTSWARTVVVGSGLHRACQAEDGPGGLRRVIRVGARARCHRRRYCHGPSSRPEPEGGRLASVLLS